MPNLQKQIEAYLKANAKKLSLAQKATGQQFARIVAAHPLSAKAMEDIDEDDDDPEAEGDDIDEDDGDDPEAESDDIDEDDDTEVEGDDIDEDEDDDDPEGAGDEDGDEDEAEARIFAILDHPSAKGRTKLARHLAKSGMSVKQAVAALKAAPKSNAALDNIRRQSQAPLSPTSGPGKPSSIIAACENLAKKQA